MTTSFKNRLKNNVWRSDNYYLLAKKGSLDVRHPGMRTLLKFAARASKILDLGCGEGTRLNLLSNVKDKLVGIDISTTAIRLAKKTHPKIKFITSDLETILLPDRSYDLVYSAYVLEHLSNPEEVLVEAIRLILNKGFLILIAPNYGAPNRVSPPFKGSRIKKFIKGIINDFTPFFKRKNDLGWTRVTPTASQDRYDIDWDTTIEPYIGSLINFLKGKDMKIMDFTTCWSEELSKVKIHQIVFRLLGEIGVYPFIFWGPHLVVVAQKNEQ